MSWRNTLIASALLIGLASGCTEQQPPEDDEQAAQSDNAQDDGAQPSQNPQTTVPGQSPSPGDGATVNRTSGSAPDRATGSGAVEPGGLSDGTVPGDPNVGNPAIADPVADSVDPVADSADPGVVLLSIGQIQPTGQGAERLVDINMTAPEAIAGFQFKLVGATLTGSAGGEAAVNQFHISTGGAGGVIGFALQGSVIPAGRALLTRLSFVPQEGAAQVCLSEPVIADPDGQSLAVVAGGCVALN